MSKMMLSEDAAVFFVTILYAEQVDAPIDKVYKIWEDPLSWNEWFDLIGQVIVVLLSVIQ